eukprot:6275834-Prymnesium_polylepis.1
MCIRDSLSPQQERAPNVPIRGVVVRRQQLQGRLRMRTVPVTARGRLFPLPVACAHPAHARPPTAVRSAVDAWPARLARCGCRVPHLQRACQYVTAWSTDCLQK